MRNAGSVFLGAWTPESMGDYCSGTNHVLPTYGYARAYSGLGVLDFVKRMTVQEADRRGLARPRPDGRTLARLEVAGCARERRDGPARRPAREAADEHAMLCGSRGPTSCAAAVPARRPGIRRSSACTRTKCRGARRATTSSAGLNRYPEPQPQALVERLARLYGVPAGQLLVGRGSDEAIDLLVRAFCRAGEDNVVICPPTFGMYKVAARIQGAAVVEVPLLDAGFALDADA